MHLFEYTDYRHYLKDFYLKQKSKNPSYSYRVFANTARLASPNYLKLVVDGKRRVTEKSMDNFVRGLSLGHDEARYFRALVLYQDCTSMDAKATHLRHLLNLRRNMPDISELTRDRFEILTYWYHWAIREMVCLKDFVPKASFIVKRLKKTITPAQAEHSLALLERLRFIQKTSEGRYIVREQTIGTPEGITSFLVRSLHCQFLKLAMESIKKDSVDERNALGLTIAIPKSKLSQINHMIKSFHSEVNQLASNEKDADEVYHLSIAFFPITKEGEK